MTTSNTTERRLIGPVALVNRAAHVTRLTCVAWVNQHHPNPAHRSFVADVLAKLMERPIAVFSACGFPNPLLCALANMGQILNRQRAASAFGFLHKLLGNPMIFIRLKAALLAAESFQAPFGAFRTDRLQPITAALIPLARAFNRCAAVHVAVAIGSDVGDAKINTQRRVNIIGRWFVNVARDQEVELAFTKDEIAFTLSGLQQLTLAFAAHKRDRLPMFTRYRPNTHGLPIKVERQDAIIIGNTAVRSVRALHLPIQLVTIAYFGKATDHHLRRQAVVSLDALVHQLLQIILPKYLLFPRHAANLVARGVCRFKRAFQRVSLVGRRLQLDLGNDFHILNCNTFVLVLQANVWRAAFLCWR